MHVSKFELKLIAIAAVLYFLIQRFKATWCQPYSTYSASTDDVYTGGLCYCNNDGSAAYCRTTWQGSNFSYTQTWSDKRGDLGMCLADGICFKVPLKKDLTNKKCNPLNNHLYCTAEEHGRIYEFYNVFLDEVVEGFVTIKRTTYGILPVVYNGQLRYLPNE